MRAGGRRPGSWRARRSSGRRTRRRPFARSPARRGGASRTRGRAIGHHHTCRCPPPSSSSTTTRASARPRACCSRPRATRSSARRRTASGRRGSAPACSRMSCCWTSTSPASTGSRSPRGSVDAGAPAIVLDLEPRGRDFGPLDRRAAQGASSPRPSSRARAIEELLACGERAAPGARWHRGHRASLLTRHAVALVPRPATTSSCAASTPASRSAVIGRLHRHRPVRVVAAAGQPGRRAHDRRRLRVVPRRALTQANTTVVFTIGLLLANRCPGLRRCTWCSRSPTGHRRDARAAPLLVAITYAASILLQLGFML